VIGAALFMMRLRTRRSHAAEAEEVVITGFSKQRSGNKACNWGGSIFWTNGLSLKGRQ